jgi:hypothetical protein
MTSIYTANDGWKKQKACLVGSPNPYLAEQCVVHVPYLNHHSSLQIVIMGLEHTGVAPWNNACRFTHVDPVL